MFGKVVNGGTLIHFASIKFIVLKCQERPKTQTDSARSKKETQNIMGALVL